MSAGGRDADAGFALVESIAVLVLSGLVLLTLLIATDLVTRNSNAATQRANAVEGLSTGLAAIRRDIGAARFTRGAGGPESPLLFQGGARAVGFVAKSRGEESQSDDLVWIEARYEQGRGLLVRSADRMTPATTGFAGVGFVNPVVLLSGPWTYRFSYGVAGAGPMRWEESWSSSKALPDALRIEILRAETGQAAFTPLVVALNVDAEVKCPPGEEDSCGPDANNANDELDDGLEDEGEPPPGGEGSEP